MSQKSVQTIRDRADVDHLVRALAGCRGKDQKRIAETGIALLVTLLSKNADYGSSVFRRPVFAPECKPAAAIRVRMSDKVERVCHLLTHAPEVRSESLEDSFRDLAGYCLLYLSRPQEVTEPQDGPTAAPQSEPLPAQQS